MTVRSICKKPMTREILKAVVKQSVKADPKIIYLKRRSHTGRVRILTDNDDFQYAKGSREGAEVEAHRA